MHKIKIDSVESLIQSLNELANNYMFRGQADAAWPLASALERAIGPAWNGSQARKFENFSLETFKSKYSIYNQSNHTPKSKLAWLAAMQHFGVPTRLLDFSTSPFVALYFALEFYDPLGKKDFSLYAIDYKSMMDKSIEEVQRRDKSLVKEDALGYTGLQDSVFENSIDKGGHDVLWIAEPNELNVRIDRQSGTFLFSGNVEKRVDDLFSSALYTGTDAREFIIDHRLYTNCYALLRKMNINSKVMYGDLQGLAKAIKMELQVHFLD